MIKSELVQRMAARNPHLYQRDIENIIDAILGEITNALARGERVELRGFAGLANMRFNVRIERVGLISAARGDAERASERNH